MNIVDEVIKSVIIVVGRVSLQVIDYVYSIYYTTRIIPDITSIPLRGHGNNSRYICDSRYIEYYIYLLRLSPSWQ